MRCKYCKYNFGLYEYNDYKTEEYSDVCGLVEQKETTFNDNGCGCIFNRAVIDKRYEEWQRGTND